MTYGRISSEALKDAVLHSSATDIDIRRMADEIAITRDRVDDLRSWAESRIACCHAAVTGRNGELTSAEVHRYEQEEHTLRVVLRLLDGEQT